jgi:hypothetical protein
MIYRCKRCSAPSGSSGEGNGGGSTIIGKVSTVTIGAGCTVEYTHLYLSPTRFIFQNLVRIHSLVFLLSLWLTIGVGKEGKQHLGSHLPSPSPPPGWSEAFLLHDVCSHSTSRSSSLRLSFLPTLPGIGGPPTPGHCCHVPATSFAASANEGKKIIENSFPSILFYLFAVEDLLMIFDL